MDSSSSSSTNLDYFDDMWKLQSTATLLSLSEVSGRFFHPQGSGQPADTGVIAVADSGIKFIAEDVRCKDGMVFHYGFVESSGEESESQIQKGFTRPDICWMHTCMRNVGLGDLEPTKGYHFPPEPYAEYKSTVPQKDIASKQKELKVEANALLSRGGKDSIPRIVKLGDSDSIGCPCGGTRVSDISEIKSIMVVPMFLLYQRSRVLWLLKYGHRKDRQRSFTISGDSGPQSLCNI